MSGMLLGYSILSVYPLNLVLVISVVVMYCVAFYLAHKIRKSFMLLLVALLILLSAFVGYEVGVNSSIITNSAITSIK